MKRSFRIKWVTALASLFLAILLLGGAILLGTGQKLVYRYTIPRLADPYHLGQETIQTNYDRMVAYSLNPLSRDLSFIGLPHSQQGLDHFTDVKVLYAWIWLVSLIALGGLIPAAIYLHKRKSYRYLTYAAGLVLALLALILCFMVSNFSSVFTLFHQLIFNNNDWLFDPLQDPIILYLPESFFFQEACFIGLLIFLACLACLFLKVKKSRRTKAIG